MVLDYGAAPMEDVRVSRDKPSRGIVTLGFIQKGGFESSVEVQLLEVAFEKMLVREGQRRR